MVESCSWANVEEMESLELETHCLVTGGLGVSQRARHSVADEGAGRRALTTAARHLRRQETAKPLLDDIRSKIEAAQSVALPSSALSKACQYALTLWKKLTASWSIPN